MKKKPVRVLVVDDELIVHELVKRILGTTDAQYELKFLTNGSKAIASIDTFVPDLLILDIDLPGKSGVEVCRYLRNESKHPNIGVLAISGDSTPDQSDNILEAGADDFLPKPFTAPELLEKIEKIISLRQK